MKSRMGRLVAIGLGCLLGSGALIAVVAKHSVPDSAPAPAPKPPLSPGEDLYNVHCGVCHLEMGTGTMMLARRYGPQRALLAERLDLDAGVIREVVRNGIGSMPPQTRVDLSDAELDQVANYLTRPPSARHALESEARSHGNE